MPTPLPESLKPIYRWIPVGSDQNKDYVLRVREHNTAMLGPCNRLVALVGANNCGKSGVLRRLHRGIARMTKQTPGHDSGLLQLEQMVVDFREIVRDAGVFGDSRRLVRMAMDIALRASEHCTANANRLATTQMHPGTWFRSDVQHFLHDAGSVEHQYGAHINHIQARWISGTNSKPLALPTIQVFIPTTRTMIPLPKVAASVSPHENPTVAIEILDPLAYRFVVDNGQKLGVSKDHYEKKRSLLSNGGVFTGQTAYTEIRDLLLGNLTARQTIRSFEQFLSQRFFGGQEIALIPRHDSDQVYIKIGTEREQPLSNLGDGLQHIVIMTLPIFLFKDQDLLLFIEEPELYLHPGYQRLLIETFLDEHIGTGLRQVFVATHSNQFLDITLDHQGISVFHVAKTLPTPTPPTTTDAHADALPEFEVRLASDDHFPLLRELGVRNSSVLLANCTIWVEGVTDRKYLQKYLDLYQDHLESTASEHNATTEPASAPAPTIARAVAPQRFVEDLHFAFVEYGGSNITHWSFLDEQGARVDRLCGTLMLIADKDTDKETRHKKLRQRLDDRFVCLQAMEIENTLPRKAIEAVIEHYEKETNEDERSRRPRPVEHDYINQKLGTYIDNLFGAKRTRRGSYAQDSGSVESKTQFATLALSALKSWDDLTDEGKRLARAMYEFIATHNPRP
ncbi:MAG: ATP-binding protein [Phycisphaerales bacterium]|nr:ATP-binding protein [Phycisphaerales bacterium]